MAGQVTPLASGTSGLDFARMSPEEIRKMSVKRIHTTPSLDTMFGPVPGGLYDPAMGAIQALQNNCTTCRLSAWNCMGHCGHIELPVLCYHPLFVDYTLRLLRASCVYCHHFQLTRFEINKVVCELRLLQHGLLDDLNQMRLISSVKPSAQQDVLEEDDEEDIMEKRVTLVDEAVSRFKKQDRATRLEFIQNPVAVEARKEVIINFIKRASNCKTCARCQGVASFYRKEKALKFFRKPLTAPAKEKMRVLEKKIVNPLIFLQYQEKAKAEKIKPEHLTNGVHTDDQDGSGSDEEGEHGAEDEIALQNAVETTARANSATLEDEEEQPAYMTSTEVHAALTLLFERERELVNLLFSSGRNAVSPDFFFLRVLLVPPNKFRPLARQGADQMLENQQNAIFTRIIKAANNLRQIQRSLQQGRAAPGALRRSLGDQIQAAVELQEQVNGLIDRPPENTSVRASESGVKQILEKKEGLFRMNMMGKRVNFAARSVISPDPNIETNEIGVPLVFAKKLTYPEPVTPGNSNVLSKAVINGSDKWPGASAIENEIGLVMSLKRKTPEQRKALAKQLTTNTAPGARGDQVKKVYRHLQSGDVVIMNRQPTLHKPSMMAHKAKVLTNQKTIRMHYANCNTYNADFDGDEMNMHFPQNELARAEATQIADTDHQYLSATSGKPLRGLIQDHISMGVQFTSRDTFFERDEYQELLYNCLRPEDKHTTFDRIEMIPPAILKPKQLWTGKQVISAILRNITPHELEGVNLTSKSFTASESWGETTVKDSSKFVVSPDKVAFRDTEQVVIFKDGHHLCGILDKGQLGPAAGGLVHSVHELYGHAVAGKLLSVLGRLLTRVLNERAWSCGIDDLYLTKKGDKARRKELDNASRLGFEVATEYVTLKPDQVQPNSTNLHERLEDVLRNDNQMNGLDQLYKSKVKSVTDGVSKACMPAGLAKPFPRNQMQAMTISGAKGSSVNANLISCNLGQQVLEGRRVPTMVSGKTLPSFRAYETDPGAGGYVRGRFLTGIKPQEYFFHAMSGREGLIDTAVKTAKSGYLQRCVVKGLEGVKVEYDNSVRDASNGSIVQFLYGEDGLEVTKQKHLEEFTFLAENYNTVAASVRAVEMLPKMLPGAVDNQQKDILRRLRKGWPQSIASRRKEDGSLFATHEVEMDPILSLHSPSEFLGCTSENFATALTKYGKENPDNILKDKKTNPSSTLNRKTFTSTMYLKYMRSLVDPGEAVGVVAAQSIGEPSTQMTLNTFHLAGHSAKNVTLGIPRLREIIMTASANLMTPTMTIKPIAELTPDEGIIFAKSISKLSLADVVNELRVTERSDSGKGYEHERIYDISLFLYDQREYEEEYAIKSVDVLRTLEEKFMPLLDKFIKADIKKKGDEALLKEVTGATPAIGASVGRTEEARAPRQGNASREAGEEGGDDDADPEDARDAAQRERRDDKYDEPDEDEQQIEKQWEQESDIDEDESAPQTPAANNNDDENDNEFEDSPNAIADAADAAYRLKNKYSHLKRFSFTRRPDKPCRIILSYDSSMAKLLLLPLLEKAVRQSTIRATPGVGQCELFMEEVKDDKTGKILKRLNPDTGAEEDVKEPVITTKGVNLLAMRDHQDRIYPHSIYTNSVVEMLKYYGVEAARSTIVKEISTVFAGHGITVDYRHINLIADAMTQSGRYKPFSRHGVVREGSSVVAKMSFETVMGVLKDAVVFGESDPLLGPSARIVAGRRGNIGTGSFDVVVGV